METPRLVRALPILIACIIILAAGSILALEIEASLNPQNERRAGTVAYSRGSPQRKTEGSPAWERLGRSGTVFGRDWIRTDEKSGLSLSLAGDSELSMAGGGDLRLDWSRFGRKIALNEGSILVRRQGARGRLTILSRGARIEIGDANLEIRAGADGLEASVNKGEAVIYGGGKKYPLKEGEGLVLDRGGKIAKSLPRAVSIDSPQPGDFFAFYGAAAKIGFSWKTGDAAYSSFLLEVSPDPSFSTGTIRQAASSRAAFLELGSGSWYARLSAFKPDGSSEASLPVRFVAERDAPMRGLEPSEGKVFPYKAKPPLVRFSWEESRTANGYLLELASDPGFSVPVGKIIAQDKEAAIDSLKEGRYWWRARPIRGFRESATEEGTKPISFLIEKRDTLPAPVPIGPAEGEIVPARITRSEGISFSWDCPPETKSSALLVFRGAETKSPLWKGTTAANAILLKTALGPGEYRWKVSSISFDGKKIADSETRSFRVSEAPAEILLSAPFDGAEIDSGAGGSEMFSWRSETKSLRLLEISPRPDMREAIVSEKTRLLGMRVPGLLPGRYYWRVSALAGGMEDSASEKIGTSRVSRLLVLPRLSAPCILSPPGGAELRLVDQESLPFSWTPVDGAESYRFKLTDSRGRTIEERENIPGTSYSFRSLKFLGEREYSWEISARDSRAGGRLGETARSAFRVASLLYLEKPILRSPEWGKELNEMDIITAGLEFSWSSDSGASENLLRIGKDPSLASAVLELAVEGNRHIAQSMAPGRYFWQILSAGKKGSKSSSDIGSFTVSPAPPLDTPNIRTPAKGERIDMGSREELGFKWDEVRDANLYLLVLTAKEGGATIFRKEIVREKEYAFTELEKLDVGEFELSFEARMVDGTGRTLRKSETLRISFSLALEGQAGNPELLGSGILYTK